MTDRPTRAKAAASRPKVTREERFRTYLGMFTSTDPEAWVRGKTGKALAKKWGVNPNTIRAEVGLFSTAMKVAFDDEEATIKALDARVLSWTTEGKGDRVPAAVAIYKRFGALTERVRLEGPEPAKPELARQAVQAKEDREALYAALVETGHAAEAVKALKKGKR